MYYVESLLRSRHSVVCESDTEKEQAEVTDKEKEQEREQIIGIYRIESLFRSHWKRPMPSKRNVRRGSREAECIPSKTCFEAAIRSEVTAHRERASRRER
jgi:hypothetical protein